MIKNLNFKLETIKTQHPKNCQGFKNMKLSIKVERQTDKKNKVKLTRAGEF